MTTTTAAAVGARARRTPRPGTRRGRLAGAPADATAARVRPPTGGHDVRLVRIMGITTHGDTAREHPTRNGGTGAPVPAPAVECRTAAADEAEQADLTGALAGTDDPLTRVAVTAERALPAALEAGRGAPERAPAAPASADGVGEPVTELRPRGTVGTADHSSMVQMSTTGPTATSRDDDETPLRTGRALAAETLAKGAAGLMGERVH